MLSRIPFFRSPRPAARHAIRYARPWLEPLESRELLSVGFPGITSYYTVTTPTIEAYSPLDNVLRIYGDGFQTSTGAYAPESYSPNYTGLFAIDNGGQAITVSAANPVAALELGSGLTSTNTQLPVTGSSEALLTVSSFGNSGGALLEVPSGENGFFSASAGIGTAPTSLETAFTPYISLLTLQADNGDVIIGQGIQTIPAPYAPALSLDPNNPRVGLVSPIYQGYINFLQTSPRATQGLLGGGAVGGAGTAPLEQVTPEELEELQREMLNHMRLLSWNTGAAVDGDTEARLDSFQAAGVPAHTAMTSDQPALDDPFLEPFYMADLSRHDLLYQPV